MPVVMDAGSRGALALARSAMEIADARLTDPGLSPSSLARDLNVSVRTLHRSFAKTGEPVAAYIRRRRLERARAELAMPTSRPDITEIAARWCFADNSHFTRAFRKQYGETPSQFASAKARVAGRRKPPVRSGGQHAPQYVNALPGDTKCQRSSAARTRSPSSGMAKKRETRMVGRALRKGSRCLCVFPLGAAGGCPTRPTPRRPPAVSVPPPARRWRRPWRWCWRRQWTASRTRRRPEAR